MERGVSVLSSLRFGGSLFWERKDACGSNAGPDFSSRDDVLPVPSDCGCGGDADWKFRPAFPSVGCGVEAEGGSRKSFVLGERGF
jgi:hypothetical protein